MTCECRLYALWRVLTRSRPFRCRVGYCNALKLDGTWCPWECSSRHKTEPETGHTARNLSWKAAWFWTSASFPPFFPPTRPLSRAQTLGMCLFLPCAVLLQFSHCCRFALLPVLLWADCSSACQGLGFLCAFFPPPFSFLCSACACCVLPCLFSAFVVVFSFFFPLSPLPRLVCEWTPGRISLMLIDRLTWFGPAVWTLLSLQSPVPLWCLMIFVTRTLRLHTSLPIVPGCILSNCSLLR